MREIPFERVELRDRDARVPTSRQPAGASPVSVAPLTRRIPVRDNTEFTIKFDKGTFKDIVARPTRTVVVDQDPDPGDLVPAGMAINLTLTVKGVIPVGSFKGIDVAVATRFATIGALEADLEKDDVAKEARGVLERKEATDYDALSTGDKQRVNSYIKNRFGVEPDADPAKANIIFRNVKFLKDL